VRVRVRVRERILRRGRSPFVVDEQFALKSWRS
jgi:hypothetical protein